MGRCRWRKIDDTWMCALRGRVLSLRQNSTHLQYQSSFSGVSAEPLTPPLSAPDSRIDGLPEDDDTEELVHHYLNLGPNLTELYEQWSSVDANFKKKAPKFAGVRILKQDAWEALVGFICSSNNNIIRISQMVCWENSQPLSVMTNCDTHKMEKLCTHYGPLLGYIGTTPYHDMPSPTILADPKVESQLRQLGFGYRAKYLYQTAVRICQQDEGWLDRLRNPESPIMGQKVSTAGEMHPGGRAGYRDAHGQLLTLQGVGPKVADCVCLMGLGWGEAVPVDTHVWQIAQRDYKFGKGKHSSLTKATYDAVGDRFRSLWGKEAGWAHSVLFTADLRAFSERLVAKAEAKTFKKEEEDLVLDGASALALAGETKLEVVETKVKREREADEQDGLAPPKTVTRGAKRDVSERRVLLTTRGAARIIARPNSEVEPVAAEGILDNIIAQISSRLMLNVWSPETGLKHCWRKHGRMEGVTAPKSRYDPIIDLSQVWSAPHIIVCCNHNDDDEQLTLDVTARSV
ncbi:MAG: hypothetical protein Q9169_004898 [Polycauliona sp. 2 TL-2023]